MADKIIAFPGMKQEQKEVTVEELFESIKAAHKLKSVVLVGIIEETGEAMVSGNITVPQGVYLLEIGKLIILNSD